MLEEELGRRLFIRNRNGARLTSAGVEFERFAQMFMQVWERARQQLAVPSGKTGVVSIAAELSLWNPLLVEWMAGIRAGEPLLAVRAHVGVPDQLVEELRTGTLDAALLYSPQLLPGFEVEPLIEERLVLVRATTRSTAPDVSASSATGLPEEYVYVDWGPAFSAQHGAHLGSFGEAGTFVGFGPLGLAYLLRAGGTGYFRRGMVTPFIEEGKLELVEGAPSFTYPAFAVYPEDSKQRQEVSSALAILRKYLASQSADQPSLRGLAM
jgi:DNA-binding transcriptional LysR family regulator